MYGDCEIESRGMSNLVVEDNNVNCNNATIAPPRRALWFGNCGACNKKLGSDGIPQLLPCLHSLCRMCIPQAIVEVNECPVCGVVYTPVEVTDNLFFKESSSKAQPVSQCEGCEDGAEATGWCMECDEALCSVCTSAHKRVKMTRNHAILLQKPSTVSGPVVYCPTHRKQALKLFCESCDELTCRDCQLTFHKTHRFKFLHVAVADEKGRIRSLMENVKHQKDKVRQSLSHLDERILDLNELHVRLRKELKDTLLSIHSALLNRAKKLIAEMKTVIGSEKANVLERHTMLEKLESRQDHLLFFTERALESEDHFALMSCRQRLQLQLQDILSQNVCPGATMLTMTFFCDQEIYDQITSFGKFVTETVPFAPRDHQNHINEVPQPSYKTQSPYNHGVSINESRSFSPNKPPTSSQNTLSPVTSTVSEVIPRSLCASYKLQPTYPPSSSNKPAICSFNHHSTASSQTHTTSTQKQSSYVTFVHSPPTFSQSTSSHRHHTSFRNTSSSSPGPLTCSQNTSSSSHRHPNFSRDTSSYFHSHLTSCSNGTGLSQTLVISSHTHLMNWLSSPVSSMATVSPSSLKSVHWGLLGNEGDGHFQPYHPKSKSTQFHPLVPARKPTVPPTVTVTPVYSVVPAFQYCCLMNPTPNPSKPNSRLPNVSAPAIQTVASGPCSSTAAAQVVIPKEVQGLCESAVSDPVASLTVSTDNWIHSRPSLLPPVKAIADSPCERAPPVGEEQEHTDPAAMENEPTSTVAEIHRAPSMQFPMPTDKQPCHPALNSQSEDSAPRDSNSWASDNVDMSKDGQLIPTTVDRPTCNTGDSACLRNTWEGCCLSPIQGNPGETLLHSVTEPQISSPNSDETNPQLISSPDSHKVKLQQQIRSPDSAGINPMQPITSPDSAESACQQPVTSPALTGLKGQSSAPVRPEDESKFSRCPVKEENRDKAGDTYAKSILEPKKEHKRLCVPRVSLLRIPVSLPPPGHPLPQFRLHLSTSKEKFHLEQIPEDKQLPPPDSKCTSTSVSRTASPSSAPPPPSSPPLRPVWAEKMGFCIICHTVGMLVVCPSCWRGFHEPCHSHPISALDRGRGRCMVCSDQCDFGRRNKNVPEGDCGLSTADQTKCVHLYLTLIGVSCSPVLYQQPEFLPHATRYVDITLIRGRLLQKVSPAYHTPSEFVSDVWALLSALTKNDKTVYHVRKLQRIFKKNLMKVYGTIMDPTLLQPPQGQGVAGEEEGMRDQGAKRKGKRKRGSVVVSQGEPANKLHGDMGKEGARMRAKE